MWLRISLAARAIGLVLLWSLGLGLGLVGSRASAERPLIAELKWIHADADAVAALISAPAECWVAPADPDRVRLARLGRVAFRSPVLLGGLAARVGMSCDSCHRNGHDNPVFHFSGVSGAPGTADVTGSVFSTKREDRKSNPVPIPTLVDASSAPPFGSILPAPNLRSFLHAAIVDEFQGGPPPPSIVDGLVAYLSALRSVGCPDQPASGVTFESDSRDLLATFDVLLDVIRNDDRRASAFVLLSLRAALERIYRRFPEPVTAREELVELSKLLALLRPSLEEKRGMEKAQMLSAVASERARLVAVIRRLSTQTDASFYQADVLRRALEGS